MADTFRLMLVQADARAGDIAANREKAWRLWQKGRNAGADLVAFPEMFLAGGSVGGLIRDRAFMAGVAAALDDLMRATAEGPALGIGAPVVVQDRLLDAWHVLHGGRIRARIARHRLSATPGGAPFFAAASVSGPFAIGDVRLGALVGDDVTDPDIAETLAETGAEILVAPAMLAYPAGNDDRHLGHLVARGVETGLPLAWVNAVGGQDELVFDGASLVLNPGGGPGGGPAVQLPQFEEDATLVTFRRRGAGFRADEGRVTPRLPQDEADYRATVRGLSDFMRKSGFDRVVLGLSGGLDSALVAAIAADALGPDHVHCLLMPSEYTSRASLDDARAAAAALGCPLDVIPIDHARGAVAEALAPLFRGFAPDVTEENVQARLRGLMLMAVSNKLGGMVLATGNKSESAVGYSTLYGDMCGGFNPIRDLYKTRVFRLAEWRNANHRPWMKGPAGGVVPEAIIRKPPSAELRPDQKDVDSLPPYDVLDRVLAGLIERERTVAELIEEGFDEALVRRVEGMLARAEYKRYQAAPGVRVTGCAFGIDRRRPLAGGWPPR